MSYDPTGGIYPVIAGRNIVGRTRPPALFMHFVQIILKRKQTWQKAASFPPNAISKH
jgi:hypothetical protein